MNSSTVNARQRRIIQLSQQWGFSLPPNAPTPLTRPPHPTSFRTHGDDEVADGLLQRRSAEVAQLRPKSGLSRAFSSSNLKKGKHWDTKEILNVLNSWVDSSGSPGVAESLIAKLAAAGVDLGGMQTQKQGLLNRRKSVEHGLDRTRLLKSAIERDQLDMVHVLIPHADPLTLDTCLPAAVRTRNARIVEVLLRYGANASNTAEGQDEFRKACSVPALSEIASLILRSDGRPEEICTSQALTDATRAQCFDTVLHLSRSTADGNYNNAEAFKIAINDQRRDIAMAIATGNKPPQSPGLDEAFEQLMNNTELEPRSKLDFAELLLCCGARGPILERSLEVACETQFFEMADLLARYGASIEHNDASALKTAISKGQTSLVGSLLNGSSKIEPALASSCVPLIPENAAPGTRQNLLYSLLRRGANGDVLNDCLILAAKTGDVHSVELLLNPHFREPPSGKQNGQVKPRISNRHAVASPDYQNGEALRIAILAGNADMAAKILFARPSNETLTAIFPLVKSLPPTDRYRMVEMFLRGALTGPALHKALQDAISEDPSQRDDALINLLLKYNADINYDDGAGLTQIINQMDLGLFTTLMQNASPQTAAAHVNNVMSIDNHQIRYEMMSMLFNARASVAGQQVAEALLANISETPVDMSLLRLILEQGRPDINGLNGHILQKAAQTPDPKVIDLILTLGKHNHDTISVCLEGLAKIPSSENKAWKLDVILTRSPKKINLDAMLVHEVQTLIEDTSGNASFKTLQKLLDRGADVNAFQARALCSAVKEAKDTIVDTLFASEKPPTAASLAFALPQALKISDPMTRLTFTKSLVESGASPREVNRALIHAISHFTTDIALICVLATYADASDGEALALAVTKESVEVLDLLLSQLKHTDETRDSCLEQAMKITDWTVRLDICNRLAKSGVSSQAASNALLVAARDGDLELGDVLIAHGASISTNGGQAIIEACRGGSVEVLDVLLKSNADTQKLTLERGFQAATEVRDLNKRAMVFQRLLKRGVSGEVVDIQLVSAAKYGEEGHEVLRVLLAAGADPNYSNGEAVVAATRSAFVGSLELLLGLWHEGGNQKKASPPTLVRAMKASWKLNQDTRLHIVQDLMKAGMPAVDEVHIALSKAVGEDEPDERLIQVLLDSGASPFTNGCFALTQAVQGVKVSALDLLLGSKTDEDEILKLFENGFSETQFSTWFSPNGLEVAKMLLAKGAKGVAVSSALVQVMKKSTDETEPLADEFVDLFVAHGVDIDFENGEPLICAASKGNAHWTERLLACKPSPQTLTLAFERVFDTARSPDEALKLFELFSGYRDGEVGLDVMTRSAGSDPILIRAISQYPRSTELLQTLLDAGFYHDQTTTYRIHDSVEEPEEVTVLAWAIAQPQKKVSSALIKMLIERGANVNFETTISRTTPLMIAIQARRPDIVKELLIEGASVDITDAMGRTPLAMATDIGGELSTRMMGNLLAFDQSKDDGSLHNSARELNFAAVSVLVEHGHHPDFPSPLHDGRSALGEVCRHGAGSGKMTADAEKLMQKVMTFLIDAGSDLTLQSHGKSLLLLCFDSADPIVTTRSFLKVAMWKEINKPFNHYTDGEFTYSPTMYVRKVMPESDTRDQLLSLLRANRAVDVYYANSGDQPDDAVGLPNDLVVQERERKARLRRIALETEDHAIALARAKEVASVEREIWNHKAEIEDARRRRLHNEDINATRQKADLEETLFLAAVKRRQLEQSKVTQSSLERIQQVAAAELIAEETRQQKMIEWESKLNSERAGNAQALSSLRISEREELERIERGADERVKRRLEAQKKLVETQERLAKRLASGPGGGADARRQIGFVEEIN
ncbi:ankyrin repeat domain-containing protein [Fusarium pseudoanthophilum]|uniref:Ankyrin repeat domain-containing protein n=1 Tax=Fusarium pseudoanthophilum TaxID=48495 RepID=A0A8H5LCN3_9HYPO|nr:ankyrin repeat domain-containing protein [Fusarium pseudoanthophilum]